MKQFSNQIHKRSEQFKIVIKACQELLINSTQAELTKNYADSRIAFLSQQNFKLGFFPSDDNLNLLIDKIGEKILLDLNLMYPSYPYNINKGLLNHHNLVMPYIDDYGNVIGLVGRTILSEKEMKELEISKYKYTNLNFSKSLYLFGLFQAKKQIRKTNIAILVEGQIDCITCHQYSLTNTVALGGSNFSKYQFYLINKLADNIYLLLDNDLAGYKGEKKIKNIYNKYSNFKKIFIPQEYKDVDEYLKINKTLENLL